jgi:N-acetylglucosamine kinase-like BadF-type ATPase
MIGDIGSAFDVGRRWIRSALGPEVDDESVRDLCLELGVQDPREAAVLAHGPEGPALIAGLAARLGERAASGCGWALAEVAACLYDLARLTVAHMARYAPQAERLELAGGLWAVHGIYFSVFEKCLEGINRGPSSRHYSLGLLADPPDLGAARLARLTSNGH